MPVDPPENPGGFQDPEPGTDPSAPAWRFQVAGVEVDPVAAGIEFTRLLAYRSRGDATLEWHKVGGAIGPLADPYHGKSITLEADWGDGYTLLFAGRCVGYGDTFTRAGWTRAYTAKGPTYLGSRVPLTSPVDGTGFVVFNAPPTDTTHYKPARAGRSVGWILRYLLDGQANAAGLIAYGLGGYAAGATAGTVGTGATATASVSAGSLTFTVTSGGSNYSASTPPRVILVGGDGTYTSASCTVSGGAVTAVSASGMSGWTVAPEVWISPLPLATLQDLAALNDYVPPFPIYAQGEKLTDALDGILRQGTKNYYLWIAPDGTIRFRDIRAFTGPTTLVIDDATDRVYLPGTQITRSVEDCFTNAKVRGGPKVVAGSFGIRPLDGTSQTDNGLAWNDGHSGLTSAQARELWNLTHFLQPGDAIGRATATPTRSGGQITALTVQSQGFGYPASTSGITVTITGGGGSGASYTANSDSLGRITSFTQGSAGSGYTSDPTVTVAPPSGGNWDGGLITAIVPGSTTSTVTIDPTDGGRAWAANFWDQTSTGRQGVLFMTDTSTPGVEAKISARVLGHPSLTAGGTCALNVEGEVPTGYSAYELFGTGGPGSYVWRELQFTDTNLAGNILDFFPFPVPYRWSDGQAVTMTTAPCASVLYSSSGSPPFLSSPIGVTFDSDARRAILDVPAVVKFGNRSNLLIGGSSTDGIPADIQILAPIRAGNLEAIQPPDSGGTVYDGTAYDVEGIAETLTVSIPEWIDVNNQVNMDKFALETLEAHQDAHLEGTITLLRFDGPLLATFGQNVRLDATNYATPWDGIDLPVMEATLTWTGGKGRGVRYVTTLSISNRRWALSAQHFVRPTSRGYVLGGGLEGLPALGVGFTGTPGAAEFGATWQPSPWLARMQANLADRLGMAQGEIGRRLANPPGRDGDPFSARTWRQRMSEGGPHPVTPSAVERRNEPRTVTPTPGQVLRGDFQRQSRAPSRRERSAIERRDNPARSVTPSAVERLRQSQPTPGPKRLRTRSIDAGAGIDLTDGHGLGGKGVGGGRPRWLDDDDEVFT
jgi:hypothetical protein